MSYRQVSETYLPNLVPTLASDRTVIAVTSVQADAAWAARVTWTIARGIASGGRRTLLADLDLESPVLDAEARETVAEGIADAFLFGVSLGYAARQQERDLYYIGAGSKTSDPEQVWSSPRWERLARGFGSQGAVMVLYLSPAGLSKIALTPDGLVILAPRGYDPAAGSLPGIKRMVEAGVPVLAVVTGAEFPVSSVARAGKRPRSTRSFRPAALVAASVVAAALVFWIAGPWRSASQRPLPDPAAAGGRVSVPEGPAADSLFYSVQVAAFSTAEQAADYAEELARAEKVVTVAPVRLGTRGVWYRVLLGALPTAAAADSLLRRLWERGLVKRPNGTILRTPFALELGDYSLEDISELGMSLYALRTPGGSERIFAGAFEEGSQASLADSLLGAAGLRGKLVRRLGIRP
ncbi:MAG: hypothetical protein KatS3mg081_0787 [Gemmatimonadales bacterium]|nr:MAG: hypothetical protein KatS3mg081_0787 [Gemmatimonadales bacterium]